MLGKDLTNEQKLNEIYKMTEENNEILRTIRRQQYFSNFLKVVYWLVILGFLGGAYYFVRPFISVFTGDSTKVEEKINQFNQMRNQLPETKLINSFFRGMQPKEEGGATTTDGGVTN